MWPAAVSTTMPSGSRQSVTSTLLSEPSGFSDSMRLPLKSRRNRRATVFELEARADFDVLVVAIGFPFVIDFCREAVGLFVEPQFLRRTSTRPRAIPPLPRPIDTVPGRRP